MDSLKHRIDALDGLRGLAILMVILNHLHIGLLYNYTLAWFHPVVSMVINSGGIGVLILFMLSGFLMATIYPIVPSTFDFWQKRYTRIFPAFIVMCVALAIIKWQSHLTLPASLALIMGVMLLGGFLWRRLQRSPGRQRIGRMVFFGFLSLQIITIICYIALQLRVPSAIYFLVWPEPVRVAINALINMTMTIPFGTYVGQLDGVYWSVIAEVSFYLLYPIIILPALHVVRRKKLWPVTLLSLAFVFPFCFGLYVLYQHIYFFSMLQIQLIIYFIVGAVIGSASDSFIVKQFQARITRLPSFVVVGVALVSVFGGIFIPASPIIKDFLIVFPLSLGFIITLNHQTAWAHIMRASFFTRLGVISYSLYLTHSIAIDLVGRYGEPATFLQMVTYNLCVIGVLGILGYLLHVTMERPYFFHSKKMFVGHTTSVQKPASLSTRFLFAGCVIIFLVWYGYRVPVSFASLVVNMKTHTLPQLVPITPTVITIPFVAKYDNLGMLMFAIRPLAKEERTRLGYPTGVNPNAHLRAEIVDTTGHNVHTIAFPLYQIYESKFFTVGLPIETQSQGKQYQLQLSIDQPDANTYMGLVNTNVTMRQIYMVRKTELFKSLPLVGEVLWDKVSLPFTEPEPWIVLLTCLPLCLTLAIISGNYQERGFKNRL